MKTLPRVGVLMACHDRRAREHPMTRSKHMRPHANEAEQPNAKEGNYEAGPVDQLRTAIDEAIAEKRAILKDMESLGEADTAEYQEILEQIARWESAKRRSLEIEIP
jgi:hypothetical protein